MKSLPRVCALALIGSALNCSSNYALDVFVSLDGNDANSGSIEQPVRTFEAARNLIREARQSEDAQTHRIIFRGGNYFLDRTLELDPEDSGTAEFPLLVQAFEGEQVTFSGGATLTNWEKVPDDLALEGISPETRKQLRVSKLPESLSHHELCRKGRQQAWESVPGHANLFVNAHPLEPARWPNANWETADQFTVEGDSESGADSRIKLHFKDRLPTFGTTHQVWAHWLEPNAGCDDWSPVDTRTEDTVTLKSQGHLPDASQALQFRLSGSTSFLDQPGEWAFSDDGQYVVAWLPENDANSNTSSQISVLETLFASYGASHVRFSNIELWAARVMAIEVAGGENFVIDRCRIHGIGNVGVHLFGGKHHQLTNCTIQDTWEGGVRVEGGDEESLEPSGHAVKNCVISRFASHGVNFRPAIYLIGVGIVAEGNQISEGPHSAIVVEGNEHLVIGNTIDRVCLDTDDVGAIWLGQDWTERGNQIVYNRIRHLGSGWQKCTVGIYLDEFASGTVVHGNYVEDAQRGIIIAGGRDNHVDQNVIADCRAGIQVDGRGLHWEADRVHDDQSDLRQRLAERIDGDTVHVKKYPELLTILEQSPGAPLGNRIENNQIAARFPVFISKKVDPSLIVQNDNQTFPWHGLSERDYRRLVLEPEGVQQYVAARK